VEPWSIKDKDDVTDMACQGFGQKISWKDDTTIRSGYKLAFKDALHTVSADVAFKLLLPNWALGLTPKLRHLRLAFDELQVSRIYPICRMRSETNPPPFF
jgi:hypothetical protein